jgi:nucleoside-diphosphate-sugar epimerase
MKVAITGATGNVGSAVVRTLSRDPAVESITGIARRLPSLQVDKVTWCEADVSQSPLEPIFDGADAVIHLAWLIQPSRDEATLRATNVDGSRRVFEAAAAAGVKTIVYASSVGTYSPGPKDRTVDESWATDGIESLFYARHKAEIERELDHFEAHNPHVRVVRLRPGLIFSRRAAVGIRRLFLGPLFPGWLAAPGRIPAIPNIDRLRFQAVHSDDVAEAYRLALHADVAGPFNIAADPILDPPALASLLRARRVRMPPSVLRGAALATWKLRLQPTPPGWLDLALAVPLMATDRAGEELGWRPQRPATEALLELLEGLRGGEGYPTPPLDPRTTAPARSGEIVTGVGAR